MEPTDGELLERWRKKDSESGEVLFERYYNMMERFFVNKVPSAVQDLVQETFMRCVQNRERIKDNNQFRLYIFGIAYNVLKAHLRERYRGAHQLDVDEVSVRGLEPGPVTLVVERREHRLLLEALRDLPIEDQAMLELHYWEDLTTDEIAEVLGIPVGTARGRLQRARGRLGELMHRLTSSAQDLTTTVARRADGAKGGRDQLDDYRPQK
jgi:RNA polymerase sigma-70 factor (ECF subfamily)